MQDVLDILGKFKFEIQKWPCHKTLEIAQNTPIFLSQFMFISEIKRDEFRRVPSFSANSGVVIADLCCVNMIEDPIMT